MRRFDTGATRNDDSKKLDYEGFLSPLALKAFAEYMHAHREQADGKLRASDNWQKGIPMDAYMKSGFRHFFDWWQLHRGITPISPESGEEVDMVEALTALLFNVQGYLHETIKAKLEGGDEEVPTDMVTDHKYVRCMMSCPEAFWPVDHCYECEAPEAEHLEAERAE